MLTGRAVFTAETASDHLAAILERDPDWTRLARGDATGIFDGPRPMRREGSAASVTGPSAMRVSKSKTCSRRPLMNRGGHARELGPGRRTVRRASFPVRSPPSRSLASVPGAEPRPRAIRTEGRGAKRRGAARRDRTTVVWVVASACRPTARWLVFRAVRDGRAQLFIAPRWPSAGHTDRRHRARRHAVLLARWPLARLTARDEIKKVRIEGGQPQLVATLATLAGVSWGDDDMIVAGRRQSSGLWRVPASGGTPERFTTVTADDGDNDTAGRRSCPEVAGFCSR